MQKLKVGIKSSIYEYIFGWHNIDKHMPDSEHGFVELLAQPLEPLRFGSLLRYINCFLTVARTSEVIEESLVRGSFMVFQGHRTRLKEPQMALTHNPRPSEWGAPVSWSVALTVAARLDS
jgi:hypothetical protein